MQELLISSEPANFASPRFPSFPSMPKVPATGQAFGLAIEIANAFSSRVGVGEVVTSNIRRLHKLSRALPPSPILSTVSVKIGKS